MKKLFERNDLLILIIISIAVISMLIPRFTDKDRLTAEISVNGEIVKTINLNEIEGTYVFQPECTPCLTVIAQKGKIRFSQADCPDKICVNTGWIDSNGETAACVPAKTVIVLKQNKNKNAPDVITY